MSELRSLDFDSSPAILENHNFFFASASGMLRWVTGVRLLESGPRGIDCIVFRTPAMQS